MTPLAYIVYRNSDGSLTALGWIWVIVFSITIVGACVLLAHPRALRKLRPFTSFPLPQVLVRGLALVALVVAGVLIAIALTAPPGALA